MLVRPTFKSGTEITVPTIQVSQSLVPNHCSIIRVPGSVAEMTIRLADLAVQFTT